MNLFFLSTIKYFLKHLILHPIPFRFFFTDRSLLTITINFFPTQFSLTVFFIFFSLKFSSFIVECALHFILLLESLFTGYSIGYTPLYDRISPLSKAWLHDILSPALYVEVPLVCVPDVAVASPTSTTAAFYYRSVSLEYWPTVR